MTTKLLTAICTPAPSVTGRPVTEFGPCKRATDRYGRPLPTVYDTAASLDGMWQYLQEDLPGVPWRAVLTPADQLDPAGFWSFGGFRSIDEAREATATWLLDQLISDQIARERHAAELVGRPA